MPHRWLTFFTIGVLGLFVFIFFWLFNRPVEIPAPTTNADVGSLTEPVVTFVNPAKGAQEPTVTIVEFGDFQCAACKPLATTLEALVKAYPQDVRVIWKDLPNESVHPLATPAAIAAHCADRQGAFWQYHDALFARQSILSEAAFTQIGQEIGLDAKKFQVCYDARDTLPIVKKDYEEGLALGLTATPTLFVGEEMFVGAVTLSDLQAAVESALSAGL